ncbi:hypothetical protein [Duganella sp. Dugasp56]|uniref:hypothetical protein n=1 Tax=Duganella sp. Dugasp56 TaxID=3243046 RepID=UPI0039B11627
MSQQSVAQTWVPITDNDLKITPGSPLDFSQLTLPGQAGDYGRLIKGANGNLVFYAQQDKKAALNCGTVTWMSVAGGYPDHATADIYVQQLKLHGYNLVRFHFLDITLMENQPLTNTFNPVQLDRFYYFISALKKAGIYWVLDMMTSDNGTVGNVSQRWLNQLDLKLRVNLDDDAAAKQSWKDSVDAIFNRATPYGGPILQDPALVGVILVNEGGINYLAQVNGVQFSAKLKAPFNAYLKAQYGTHAALAAKWGTMTNDPLTSAENLDNGTIILPTGLLKPSERMKDFQRFLTQQEGKTVAWMTDYVRGLGFEGQVTSLSSWYSLQASRSRSALDAVDIHGYFNEVGGYQPGLTTTQASAAGFNPQDSNFYLNNMTTARHAGKPFSVSEYGQVFFNQYRFEASAMVPSIAALQGWDFNCVHAEGPIDLSLAQTASHKIGIQPYNPGMDPVLRAGETLSVLLFLRGDVTPSPNRVTISYPDPDYVPSSSGVYTVPADLRVLGLVTGVELAYGNQALPPVAGTRLTIEQSEAFPSVSTVYPADRLKSLRDAGILPTAASNLNATDGWHNVYQSDTGELLLETEKQRFTVKTARTEALTTAQAISNVPLKVLKINSLDSAALLSASTLSEGSLASSEKILLIFATDALNSGMTFQDTARTKLATAGKLPVLVRSGLANVTLSLTHKTPMRLVALDLKGNRQDEIPLTSTDTAAGTDWQFNLNNVSTSFGPTTFFLLEKKVTTP